MKSKMAAFWFAVSLAMGAALAVQWNQHRKAQQKLETVELQLEQAAVQFRSSSNKLEEVQRE
jgi:hypothetical protein